MKRFRTFSCLSCLGIMIFITGCEIEEVGNADELSATGLVTETSCDAIIDFNNIDAGTIVDEISSGNGISGVTISGVVSVYGENLNPARPDENHAMIFDTDNPTGGDEDLVVPDTDHQEVLIISEDLDSGDPDDDDIPGGTFTFDFSGFGPGHVAIGSFTTIDNEEAGEFKAYDGDGVMVASGPVAEISDNTEQTIMVNAANIVTLVVTLNGSGALDNFCINVTEEDSGCTYTQGFWKNEKKGAFPDPYNRSDVFFLSEMTWQKVLKTSPKGNAYFQAAHQYIAAVLNGANGASYPDEVEDAIELGTTLFDTYTPAEIADLKGNDELRAQFRMVNDVLDDYNNGRIGPGHCDD
ncbi:hypothetical protein Murru_3196 [Allomuricauda ruestringensis DSM 13258]|uniref:Uncharacterized protein n=1 Tax=Allomuricauda ruestringensis (strain DSM 13258 / CIP 107369 / LMG 19739 / B1) TaxID=886377 RepID=G2PLU7_ALLRU|nr:hypothetical protein [Allomuricauda ruestringensis]AEM72216.1 hypothetical protein Murru_3196 [Allomuricauda ruestringensis DSM 13258]